LRGVPSITGMLSGRPLSMMVTSMLARPLVFLASKIETPGR
jgi:hypothetical protein